MVTPEIPHGIAILPIPLRPEQGEVAHLVASFPQIPGFGNQFDGGQHRILVNDIEEGGQAIHLVEFPGQGRGQVEAKAVHVHLQHPVAQTIHN